MFQLSTENLLGGSVFLRQQLAQEVAEIRVSFCQAQFVPDDAAKVVVAAHLNEVSHLLAFQPEGIQAAILDFPLRQFPFFQKADEPGVACGKSLLCGGHKLLLVR